MARRLSGGLSSGVGLRCIMSLRPSSSSSSSRKRLLIAWHSMTGGSQQMAEAAYRGAVSESGSVDVSLLHASKIDPRHVVDSDGFIFVTPENLAAMSGLMKDMFDRSYYHALGKLNGRPYSVMICAGSDGENAARQVARIATGWRLKSVSPPLIVITRAQTPEAILAAKVISPVDLERCEDAGKAIAAGLGLGVF